MNDLESIILTDNGKVVLSYMQAHDQVLVGKDLIELTGVKGIYPVLESLKKKGLVTMGEPISRDFVNNKGETHLKEYKTYTLTDKGRNYQVIMNLITK